MNQDTPNGGASVDSPRVKELATRSRSEIIGAWDEVRDGSILSRHADELAYLNHLAEGDASEPKPELVEALAESARDINVDAPPALGAVAPVDELNELASRLVDIKHNPD